MQFAELIANRYSVRGYKSDPVPDEMLQKVLSAALLAPTACNNQPFRLIVVHTEGRQEELRSIYPRDWFVHAPLVLCACAVQSEAWVRRDGKSYLDVDIAIVMDHLILGAANLGLGTCWIANFNLEAARQVLDLPAEVEPLIFTPLGFPADEPSRKIRKPLEMLVRYEHW